VVASPELFGIDPFVGFRRLGLGLLCGKIGLATGQDATSRFNEGGLVRMRNSQKSKMVSRIRIHLGAFESTLGACETLAV
jgi:hypothetical protein